MSSNTIPIDKPVASGSKKTPLKSNTKIPSGLLDGRN
jgi:hypothetical protein